jgi:hypothetical protein
LFKCGIILPYFYLEIGMIRSFVNKIFERRLFPLERALDAILNRLKALHYKKMSTSEYNKLISEVDCLFKEVKNHKEESIYPRLMAKAVAAKLGGRIPFSIFLDPSFDGFSRFVKVNALEHKMQTLKMAMMLDEGGSPLIPIFSKEKKSYYIPWQTLCIVPILGGYSFRYFNLEVFRTHANFALTHDYILTFKGITEYHPHHSDEIIPFDKRDPSEWGESYMMEVWSLIKDSKEDRPTMGIGDHCHIILKDKEGFVYSMGKFGAGRRFKFKDYLTLFGPKPGRFISPDFICYYAEGTRNLKKKQIELTEEQFEKLYALLCLHRKNKAPVFSILKNNCASYIQSVLQNALDIQVDVSMFLPHYALRASLSKKTYQTLLKTFLAICPKWLYKPLCFFPLLYVPMIISGLLIFALGSRDFSIKDLFLKPWTLTIDHPIALREELKLEK